ncbi:unnamed protein product [Closterium sp. Naga37s-1]|nr:unnamed protein product [Closterium sp. Naga37s-1]
MNLTLVISTQKGAGEESYGEDPLDIRTQEERRQGDDKRVKGEGQGEQEARKMGVRRYRMDCGSKAGEVEGGFGEEEGSCGDGSEGDVSSYVLTRLLVPLPSPPGSSAFSLPVSPASQQVTGQVPQPSPLALLILPLEMADRGGAGRVRTATLHVNINTKPLSSISANRKQQQQQHQGQEQQPLLSVVSLPPAAAHLSLHLRLLPSQPQTTSSVSLGAQPSPTSCHPAAAILASAHTAAPAPSHTAAASASHRKSCLQREHEGSYKILSSHTFLRSTVLELDSPPPHLMRPSCRHCHYHHNHPHCHQRDCHHSQCRSQTSEQEGGGAAAHSSSRCDASQNPQIHAKSNAGGSFLRDGSEEVEHWGRDELALMLLVETSCPSSLLISVDLPRSLASLLLSSLPLLIGSALSLALCTSSYLFSHSLSHSSSPSLHTLPSLLSLIASSPWPSFSSPVPRSLLSSLIIFSLLHSLSHSSHFSLPLSHSHPLESPPHTLRILHSPGSFCCFLFLSPSPSLPLPPLSAPPLPPFPSKTLSFSHLVSSHTHLLPSLLPPLHPSLLSLHPPSLFSPNQPKPTTPCHVILTFPCISTGYWPALLFLFPLLPLALFSPFLALLLAAAVQITRASQAKTRTSLSVVSELLLADALLLLVTALFHLPPFIALLHAKASLSMAPFQDILPSIASLLLIVTPPLCSSQNSPTLPFKPTVLQQVVFFVCYLCGVASFVFSLYLVPPFCLNVVAVVAVSRFVMYLPRL